MSYGVILTAGVGSRDAVEQPPGRYLERFGQDHNRREAGGTLAALHLGDRGRM
jgi:hypothetical protein